VTRLIPILLLCATPAQANDKVLHALAGTAVYGATGSLAACVAAGVGKEVYDATGRGTVEAADALATVLPCLLMHMLRPRTTAPKSKPATEEVDREGMVAWANGR
jgi:hypothetical protein